MRKSLWSLATTVAILTTVPASAEAWRVAASGEVAVMLVDTDSIIRRGDTVFAVITTVATPQVASDWDRSVIRREIDCANSRSAMLERAFYRGSTLISREVAREPFDTHMNGSMMGGVLLTICGRREYLSGVLSDPIGSAWAMLRGGK